MTSGSPRPDENTIDTGLIMEILQEKVKWLLLHNVASSSDRITFQRAKVRKLINENISFSNMLSCNLIIDI